MSFAVLDQYTQPYVVLWSQFREEILPDSPLDPVPVDEWWELQGPTENLDALWSAGAGSGNFGPRGQEILARVRAWVSGAEQSAIDDRKQAEHLLLRSAAQAEMSTFRQLSPSERERTLDQLLRTIAGLSATIRNEQPRAAPTARFRINWQQDGDGMAFWEAVPPTRSFSLREAAQDLCRTHGRFTPALVPLVTRQMIQDLRQGELTLPLLARTNESTTKTTWLQAVRRGNPEDKGLLLPERTAKAADEIVFWQRAPRIARIYDEALFVAAREDIEPAATDLARIDAPVAVEDEWNRSFLGDLCKALQESTSLSLQTICAFLATPLAVITAKTADALLQRRARSWLGLLQQFLVKK
jgi:hypothetical protein